MQDGASAELRGAATEVVHIVVLESDLVASTSEVQVPVVVSVASGRVGGLAIDVGVGDGHAVGSILAQDNVLAADGVGGDVVDPDQIRSGQSDGITSPNILRVQLRNANVLDDDVLDTVGHAKTLALDYSRCSITKDGLVRGDLDGVEAGIVIGDGHSGSTGLVVCAPVVLVDSQLASTVGTPRGTAILGRGALRAGEVKGLLENDHAGFRVLEIRDPIGQELAGALAQWADDTTYSSSVVVG